MLIRFEVGNFRSIHEPVEVSMVAVDIVVGCSPAVGGCGASFAGSVGSVCPAAAVVRSFAVAPRGCPGAVRTASSRP